MAGSSLLTLLDDIATLLDDISVMGKLAAKKTAGVLGDDLSLNAQQVTGVRANRELPVVWQVAKGSLVNKVILVPLALLISAFIPWAITPLLMLGGAFLCFEGMEKVLHSLASRHENSDEQREARLSQLANQDPMQYERTKVKGAIRTDFILSAEIVALTLGIVSSAPLLNQIMILAGIALLVTVGVYGIVGVIVKLDDMGWWLEKRPSVLAQVLGKGLLVLAPWLMKVLSVVGTLAMFLVGGGILVHGVPWLHHHIEAISALSEKLPAWLITPLATLVVGMLLGTMVVGVVNLVKRFKTRK
ncbi:DUF808 family protein [Mangrovibacter yixingensis]|uniref:DUF808 family protein n=1 Tax=Mangrovibacter yixingensis TaxID=1529639 RepID=UPI001CF9C92D|nr:DUF808 family protein [Mangrovibacter yixingensis]